MSFVVVCALCLLQAQAVGPTPPGHTDIDVLAWRANHTEESAQSQAVAAREATYEEQQFANKFNDLVERLQEFAEQYNHHVIDIKKVKALKKAWRELEKTDAWFRLDEKAGR